MLNEKVLNVFKERFSSFTKIQELSIPKILEGKNLLIIAPTGSGKTEAALIPILSKIVENPLPLSLIYVTPLRALNRDLLSRFNFWAEKLDLEVAVRHSDTTKYLKRKQTEFPPQILISTVESFQTIFISKLKNYLKNVRFLVIDEVQEIIDTKRGVQLSLGINRLKEFANFQTIMLSATFRSYEAIKMFCEDFEIVEDKSLKKYEIEIVLEKNFEKRIEKILKNLKRGTIVFVNTREEAELIARELKNKSNLKIEVHHSSLSREVREEVEKKFKNREIDVIVATSSLQLGIDIGHVDFVIQYNSPRQCNVLLQRIGRASHFVEKVSRGLIICSDEIEYEESRIIKEEALKGFIEKQFYFKKPLDVLAQQIILYAFERIDIKEVYKKIVKNFCYKDLSYEEFLEVVEFLKKHKLIFEDNEKIRRSKLGLRYFVENISFIPSIKQYDIIDLASNKRIGTLDENFVALEAEEGKTFLIKGEPWKIVKIEDKIFVEPSSEEAIIPSWEGELLPVEYEIASKMKIEEKAEIFTDKKYWYYVFIFPYGNRVNETILFSILSTIGKYYSKIFYKSLAYGIVFRVEIRNDEIFKEALKNLEIDVEAIRSSRLYEYKFYQMLKKFGIIRKDAEVSKPTLRMLINNYKNTIVEKEVLNEIFTEKFDIENFLKIKDKLKNLKFEERKEPSNFSLLLLKRVFSYSEIPTFLETQILEKVKKRLYNTKLYLVCLNCGNVENLKVENIDFKNCKKCNSVLISVSKKDYSNIVKRKIRNLSLKKEEEKILNELYISSNLFQSFGKYALLVFAGKGIGTKTAQQIFKSFYGKEIDENELIKIIFEKEKEFVKIRQFL